MDVSELRRQHRELGDTARKLTQAIGMPDRPDGVSAVRWQLARQLMTHLALEDRILYPAMRRSDDNGIRDTADRLHRETGALAATFSTYMTEWSDARISREWRGFCIETGTILRALGERIEREDRTLYPLAETLPRAMPSARTG